MVSELAEDFDRVVAQLLASGEDVQAGWKGESTRLLNVGETEMVHTHDLQCYSAAWLRACLRLHPGSHRLGRAPGTSGADHHNVGGLNRELLDRHPLEEALPIVADPARVLLPLLHPPRIRSQPFGSDPQDGALAALRRGGDETEDPDGHPDARLVLRGRNPAMTRSRAGR